MTALGDSMRRRMGRKPPRSGPGEGGAPRGPGRFRRALRWIGAGLLVALLSLGIGYLVAVRVIFPPIAQPLEGGIAVPALIGLDVEAARAAAQSSGFLVGDVVELPHPTRPPATVLAQTPLPGQQLRPGSFVSLGVSAGPATYRLPDLVGFPAETAEEILTRAGFVVARSERHAQAAIGRVLEVDPPPGTEAQVGSRVGLLISAGPERADTLDADTEEDGVVLPPVLPPL